MKQNINRFFILAAAGAALLGTVGTAQAQVSSATLKIFGAAKSGYLGNYSGINPATLIGANAPTGIVTPVDGNTPVFQITNTSTKAGVTLTGFSFFMGGPTPQGQFDFASPEYKFSTTNILSPGAFTSNQITPGGVQNNGSPNPLSPFSDTISYTFTGFDLNEKFEFQTDLDPGTKNFRKVFFNNGVGIANATLLFKFSDGQQAFLSLPDTTPANANASSYTYSVQAVPELSTVTGMGSLLAGGGLTMFGGVIRRRRKSAKVANL